MSSRQLLSADQERLKALVDIAAGTAVRMGNSTQLDVQVDGTARWRWPSSGLPTGLIANAPGRFFFKRNVFARRPPAPWTQ